MRAWLRAPLGELTSKIGSGATPAGGEAAYQAHGIPFIRSLNVYDGEFRRKGLAFLSQLQADDLANVVVQSNDVLLNITGASVARCCIAPDDVLPARVNQHVAIIRPHADRLLPRFLQYLLVSSTYKDRLLDTGEGAGSTRQALTKAQIQSFVVEYPESLREQARIVTILDEAFAAIATAKSNAEKNLLNARELFSRISGAVLAQVAPISRMAKLEDVVEPGCSLSYGIVQPGDESAGGLPIVRPVDLNCSVVGLAGLKRIDPALAKSYERTQLKGNDILLCVRGTTGTLALASSELAGANVTRGIVPIRFDAAQLSQDFGYWLMRSEPVQLQIRAKTYGTALMQINIRDLRQLSLPVPPLHEQGAIVQRLGDVEVAVDQLIATYERKLAALDELKKSLLHQAFTGQL